MKPSYMWQLTVLFTATVSALQVRTQPFSPHIVQGLATRSPVALKVMIENVPDVVAIAANDGASKSAVESLAIFLTNLAQKGGLPAMALAVTISDSVPLLPTQPISIIAGAVFGFQSGLTAVICGQALATLFALTMGRQLGSNILDFLGEETGAKVQKVLQELGLDSTADYKKVFTTILVARQSPVLPFSVGNYMVGAATQAPILPALLGTVLGCIPLNCVWVGAGAGGMTALDMLTRGGAEPSNPYLGTIEAVGVAATIVTVVAVAKAVWSVWNDDGDE